MNGNVLKIQKERLTGLIFFGMVIFCLLVSSCATKTEQAECQDIVSLFHYYDSVTFDAKLARTLACSPSELRLTLPAPESTGAIPQRLDNWLAAVDSTGGDVRVEKDPAFLLHYSSKAFDGGFVVGVIFDLVEIAKIAYKKLEDKKLYMAAKDYDVRLLYKEGSGEITQVVFLHK